MSKDLKIDHHRILTKITEEEAMQGNLPSLSVFLNMFQKLEGNTVISFL